MTGGGSVVMATHRSAAATRIESSRGHIAPHRTTSYHTANTCACGSRETERERETECIRVSGGERKREREESSALLTLALLHRLLCFDPRSKAKSIERRQRSRGEEFLSG